MQNATAFRAVMKDTFLSDSIENSVFVGSPLLDQFVKLTPEGENGDTCRVAVRTGLSGGYSAVSRNGSSELNEGTNIVTKRADYLYSHNWFDVIIESAVIDESATSALALSKGVEAERTGAVDGIKRQLQRGLFSDGSGIICSLEDSEGAVTTFTLDSTGKGALKRGHLYPGLKVDIGTKAAEDEKGDKREITAVSVKNGTITISGAAFDTEEDGKFFVSIANARDGEESFEVDGLLAMLSDEVAYGGIDPAEVPSWAAFIDDTAQDVSTSLVYELEDEVFQSSGEEPDWCISSAKQIRILSEELQAQVRFNAGDSYNTGKRNGLTTPQGTPIERHFDCPDRCLFMLKKSDLGSIRSKQGPQWASSEMIRYIEGTTHYRGALYWRLNSALTRRNTHAAATALN
jgi:hypothetical protein